MPKKIDSNQSPARRAPTQQRARHKIELILEAAARIIARDGMPGFTTNRVAQVAGVSIGTLYQYFSNKQQIIDTLARHELQRVLAQLTKVLSHPAGGDSTRRIQAIIRAVFGAFGGRSQVHRALIEAALAQGKRDRIDQGPAAITAFLIESGLTAEDGRHRPLSSAEAFVLTHAFSGVVRAANGPLAEEVPREQIERALERLILGFFIPSGDSDLERGQDQ